MGCELWKVPWDNSVSPKVLCQLELTMKDGSKKIIISDETWKGTTNGPLQFAEIYDGEIYNANLVMPGWATNKFNDKNWTEVEVENLDNNYAVFLKQLQMLSLFKKRINLIVDVEKIIFVNNKI